MGDLKPGIIVQLPELTPASQYYKPLQSLRVMGSCCAYLDSAAQDFRGKLERYSAETGMALITLDGARLRVDTQHLRDVQFRTGSLYQFIGELMPDPGSMSASKLMLQARVARNVDGMDLDLYDKALKLRRQFEQKYLPKGP